ncbi:hypothetical protein HNO88_004251 [Novosphingobium chloroacetimidivorans]|uniref:PilZ domain-containing protein n=1 Tax=Novosphingobium chloroacetimidivorans TaxID=1428314 RepID=A0A7W7KDM1_9SPHN|nr:PilZ domain-containing protein [Novosphingobium chloroacetimidivorans]MBB4860905.1 hypothetical protein [Novosphingobium chloroacetimidivorans]
MKTPQERALEEFRRSARCKVDRLVPAEHRRRGEFQIHLLNVSAHGFMAVGESDFQVGERLSIRLAGVGWIEGHLVWSDETRAGFEFERLIRLDEFTAMRAAFQL